MEINSINATVPTDRSASTMESKESKQSEQNESVTQENREAYRVDISKEAQKKMESETDVAASALENSEAVKAYSNAGRLAG